MNGQLPCKPRLRSAWSYPAFVDSVALEVCAVQLPIGPVWDSDASEDLCAGAAYFTRTC